jgi:class 3 adenylate cyclase
MAVCGLPESNNKLHASEMVKFALSCCDKMAIITKIEQSLGSGTADLALRVGLLSGPTVGGVLRGEKARFQVFGVTMSHTVFCFGSAVLRFLIELFSHVPS